GRTPRPQRSGKDDDVPPPARPARRTTVVRRTAAATMTGEPMLTRRTALTLGLTVPGLVGLAACGPNASSRGGGGSRHGAASLRLAWWGNPTRDENTKQVVEAFKEVDDAISVSLEPGEWSGYWDKLATQTAGGDTPDVIQMDEKYIAEY